MQQRRTESDETRTGRRGAPLDRGGRLSIASGGDQQILLGGLTIGLTEHQAATSASHASTPASSAAGTMPSSARASYAKRMFSEMSASE